MALASVSASCGSLRLMKSPGQLVQPQTLCRIYLGHLIDLRLADPRRTHRLKVRFEPVGMQRIPGLPQVARENAVLRPDGANRLGVIGHPVLLAPPRHAVVNE